MPRHNLQCHLLLRPSPETTQKSSCTFGAAVKASSRAPRFDGPLGPTVAVTSWTMSALNLPCRHGLHSRLIHVLKPDLRHRAIRLYPLQSAILFARQSLLRYEIPSSICDLAQTTAHKVDLRCNGWPDFASTVLNDQDSTRDGDRCCLCRRRANMTSLKKSPHHDLQHKMLASKLDTILDDTKAYVVYFLATSTEIAFTPPQSWVLTLTHPIVYCPL